MERQGNMVDGFGFLPPKLSAWIRTFIPHEDFKGTIPFHPLTLPLSKAKITLVTSAGISLKSDPPFDMERENLEPIWGDPTCRTIPKGTREKDIEINHLHINTIYIKKDMNVMLPLERMEELATKGVIGELAPTSYSFYGFQWQGTEFLETAIRPMIDQMKAEAVDAALLTPAWPFCCRSVGLAARLIEENGISTVVLTPMPEFHNAVGIPRSVAVAYPFGRLLGQVNDRKTQRQILQEALSMLEDAKSPGEIRHLPFIWPEEPAKTQWHPAEISPIVKANLDQIKKIKTNTSA